MTVFSKVRFDSCFLNVFRIFPPADRFEDLHAELRQQMSSIMRLYESHAIIHTSMNWHNLIMRQFARGHCGESRIGSRWPNRQFIAPVGSLLLRLLADWGSNPPQPPKFIEYFKTVWHQFTSKMAVDAGSVLNFISKWAIFRIAVRSHHDSNFQMQLHHMSESLVVHSFLWIWFCELFGSQGALSND